jgi:hypothetical protein
MLPVSLDCPFLIGQRIEFRKFEVLPVLHVQIPISKRRQA